MNKKIKTRDEIGQISKELKQQGKKIATTNGSFDLLHIGHVKSLEKAAEHGDVLIIGLNSDSSIQQYKSKDRPIVPQEQRAEMLAALECVDYVVIFDETDPRALLEVIKPDFHIKSKEGFKGIEKDVVEKNGGKIVLMEDIEGFSTTNIIQKILKIYNREVN